MAFSIGGLTSAVPSIGSTVQTISNSINTANPAGISSALSAANSALSGNTSSLSTANLTAGVNNLGSLANNLLGPANSITKSLGQVSGTLGVISKLTGALGGTTNPLQSLLSNALTGTGLEGLSKSIEQLTSVGAAVAGAVSVLNPDTSTTRTLQELATSSDRSYLESFKPLLTSIGSSTSFKATDFTTNNGRVVNPLRNANSFNYVITLGIVDAATVANPTGIYNGQEFKQVLLKSGGGSVDSGYSNRIRTSHEGQENAEYYLEDFELSAVVAPNPSTGTTLGTTITFKIIEPFSLGKVIEAMMVGAKAAGFNSYTNAPFCWKIEFLGWDERGERRIVLDKPKYVLTLISEMNMSYSEKGTVYDCKGVAWSDGALSNTANKIKVPVTAFGKKVHEVLENSAKSVTNVVNGHIEKLEEKKFIVGYDRYIICFPKTKTAIHKAVQGQGVDVSQLRATTDAAEQERIRLGLYQKPKIDDPDTNNQAIRIIPSTSPNQYLFLKAWATDTANINEWGMSDIIDDTRDGGNVQNPPAGASQDSGTRVIRRQMNASRTPEKARKADWNEGTTITAIIDQVLKTSVLAKEQATAESRNGFKKAWRIETLVFIENGGTGVEGQLGRPRKTYVYAVHTFWTHEARHLGPGQKPKGIEQLKKLAKKEYNYYYTGKNEDIIKLDLKFNNSFFQNMRADIGQNSSTTTGQEVTSTGKTQGSQLSNAGSDGLEDFEEPKQAMELSADDKQASKGGFQVSTVNDKTKVAIFEQFYNRLINSPADMVQVEFDIWGDPYFIPGETAQRGQEPAAPGVYADGSMAYVTDEVYCVINFKTPLDYFVLGSRMDIPKNIPAFTGLYQIIGVVNKFSQGKFIQSIKAVRLANQGGENKFESSSGSVTGSGAIQAGYSVANAGPAANANPNPQSSPALPASIGQNVVSTITNKINTNNLTGLASSFSQERIMTGTAGVGTQAVINSTISTITGALTSKDAQAALASLSSITRLGVAANASKTIFPMQLPNPIMGTAGAQGVISSVGIAANLLSKGLNGPAGSSLAGLGNIVSGLASGNLPATLNQVASKLGSTVNPAASGVSSQARPESARPPVGADAFGSNFSAF